ncbi:hypothetical protein [Mammaliicoccus vitulinus]|uniref:hypothetical protein n=1 Tax=Mammaliicoccus vitulinus TaxID=71237 RepID=UPI0018692154|nr:hypothetical protein [Mammaliicoccus vitulinus]
MRDLITDMYNAFLADEILSEHVDNQSIKFINYPNANEIKNTMIVIDELQSPTPRDYADDDNLTYEYAYQIDVFVKQNSNTNSRLLCERLILRVQRIMWLEFGFGVLSTPKPNHDEEHALFRQTTVFKGKQYYEI